MIINKSSLDYRALLPSNDDEFTDEEWERAQAMSADLAMKVDIAKSPKKYDPTQYRFTKTNKSQSEDTEALIRQRALELIQGVDQKNKEGRDAAEQEMAVEAGKVKMDQRARSGAAGMGLSGASQSLAAGTAAKMARSKALALDEYDRKARAEKLETLESVAGIDTGYRSSDIQQSQADFEKTAFDIAMLQLEGELDSDLNKDGKIGGLSIGGTIGDGDPNNDPDPNDDSGSAINDNTAKANDLAGVDGKELEDFTRAEVTAIPIMPDSVNAYAMTHDFTFVGYAEGLNGIIESIHKRNSDGQLFRTGE